MTRGVTIERVSFGYGATAVLDDVSLEVGKGEFFAFLGPSGSGKTTLLRLVAGFGTPGHGRILIGERDVTGLPPWSRNVGMVFQSYALWPHMTVAKNVAFGLERRKLTPRRDRAARSPPCWSSSGSPPSPTAGRRSSPAASSSASRSPAPW